MPAPSLRFSRLAALSRLGVWVAALGGGALASDAAWRAVLLTVAVALGGCAALPSQVERPQSYARSDVADTQLAWVAAASAGDEPALSGFRLLPDGAQALATRIALIRRAEKTLDVQYYLIASDATGHEFVRELCAAAARGVRVRVLVDDLYATGQDELFAGLAAHDNVEVRLFNPLPVRNGNFAQRIALSLHQFSRINHRMHNKLFIADGSFAVTGGRNIADEYFDRGGDANFIDMDVLSSGPVVPELAAVFDRYWNSDTAYPVQSLVAAAPSRQDFERHLGESAAAPAAADPQAQTVATQLASGRVELEHAAVEVFADSPLKASGDTGPATVAQAHLELLRGAHSSVLLASPYFVPGEPERRALSALRAQDVDVSVLTNSLATTDEPLVHFGYARHRAALLDAGVDLHELMPSAATGAETTASFGSSGSSGHGNSSLGRLHSKVAVIDDERVFLGSMNMDARSARLNTEAGIVIHSRVLARMVAKFVRGHQREGSYQVRLEGKHLAWLSGEGADRHSRTAEPVPAAQPALPIRLLAQMLGEGML
ncbi:MAG: phospholipase D-like domain-containing protein [Caldimonas sp.]